MKKVVLTTGLVLFSALSSGTSLNALAPVRLSVSAQSYDPRLFGTWEVHTIVVDSDCKYVREGLKSTSKLSFHLVNGKLVPKWYNHDWDLVANRLFKLNDNDKLLWVRENKLQRGKHLWVAKSTDVFNIQNQDYITAESDVEQYLNGHYTGDYKTISYLKKL